MVSELDFRSRAAVRSTSNKSTINGTLVFTADDGKTLFDMVWTRKRQAGVAG